MIAKALNPPAHHRVLPMARRAAQMFSSLLVLVDPKVRVADADRATVQLEAALGRSEPLAGPAGGNRAGAASAAGAVPCWTLHVNLAARAGVGQNGWRCSRARWWCRSRPGRSG